MAKLQSVRESAVGSDYGSDQTSSSAPTPALKKANSLATTLRKRYAMLSSKSGGRVRKLILKMSITLDGVVGSPDGKVDFTRSMSPEGAAWLNERISQAGAHLLGRKTFTAFAAFWPDATNIFSKTMNEIPKIFFSRTGFDPSTLDTNDSPNFKSWKEATIAKGDLAAEIAKLKSQSGKDLVAQGGAEFGQSLVQTGLVDEYWLVTHPIVANRGLKLFDKLTEPLYLELIEAKTFASGTVVHIYRPQK